MLSSLSGYSTAHLVDQFHTFLETDPPELRRLDQADIEEAFLLIDGLWFGRWFVYFYNQDKLSQKKAKTAEKNNTVS